MTDLPVKADKVADHENCWSDVRALFALIARKLSVTLPIELVVRLWTGASEPPSEKKDWLWFNKTTKGKPVGFFSFYKGKQVPVWPSPGKAAPIMVFSGLVESVESPFAVCDGRDGTPNMSAQMLVVGTPPAAPIATDFVGGVINTGDLKDATNMHLGYMQLIGYED